MKENIIGREQEIEKLENYISSRKSEFVAIYGRRRVGKTFLVKELFENRFTFRITGKDNVTTKEQLASFSFALNDQLGIETDAANWPEAFRLLQKHWKRCQKEQKSSSSMNFLGSTRMPPTSSAPGTFLERLGILPKRHQTDSLWKCYHLMLNQVINSRGGLHNRITHNILLSPFKLHEVEEYFKAQGFYYERPEIIECYMAVGGVAYYLSLFENNKSVAQNIQQLCFTRGGELTEEFDRLFSSLFKKADNHLAIVTALKNKGKGMTRQDLLDATGLANNGRFSQILKELEQCDFIRSYTPFGKSKKDMMYQLIDPYCLFYFKFMHNKGSFLDNYWVKMQTTAEYESWCGHAFEIVCLHHINEIIKALGIDGCINSPCSWSYRPTAKVMADDEADEDLKRGTQIDLLIDRSDKSISICEMKFCNGEYEITKAYDAHLAHRLKIFKKVTKTTKTLIPTFVTPHGLYNNMYARKINRQVTGDDLF